MTDQEMQKIIQGLANDPEVGPQVRALLAARVPETKLFAMPPDTKLELDPGLVRQVKQFVALNGGGTFREQFDAQLNQGCATAGMALIVIGGMIALLIGLPVLIMFLASLSWPHATTQNSQDLREAYAAHASPSPTVRVLRALPARP